MFSFDKINDAVMLTGASGFLGQHVYKELEYRGYERIVAVSRHIPDWMRDHEYAYADLRKHKDVNRLFRTNKQIKNLKGVINLAASVGGIGANQKKSAEFMMDSLRIGINLIECSMHNTSMKNGGKFVQIGTVCSYPKNTPVPFKEENIWNGYPEETNAAYGIAKKTLMELVKQYNIQYAGEFKGINLIPVNLYGPGDSFDLENSHVIPALIRKIDAAIENNSPNVILWGTGSATREFLFVKDAAEGIVDAFEKYEGNEPVNLGTGQEIDIYTLARHIAYFMGFKGEIVFDTTKPDGQPRRCLDVTRAKHFGFSASTLFQDGIKETINWYRNNKSWLTQ